MSDLNKSQQAAAEKAKVDGFKVIRGKPTLLLIDLDTAGGERAVQRYV